MDFERTIPYKKEKPWQWQEGNLTVTRSVAWSAPGCHDGCGVLMYSDENGKLVKVEGDPENPYNQGRLCMRCLAMPEVLANETRILHPMKRAHEDRGKDAWEEITWDEAYDICEREIKRLSAEYGPETVIFTRGTARDMGPWANRLSYTMGTPNHVNFGLSGVCCYLPRVCLMNYAVGNYINGDWSQWRPNRYNDPEYVIPGCIVLWGSNPLNSNADGNFGHWLVDLMKRGSTLITVDPRLTWLSVHSKYFLQLRPGTDAAMALGWLNVIINEDLYDHDFVDKWCYGFNELAKRVQEYTPQRVAEITWVPEEKIVAAARFFATHSPANIQWGLAIDMAKEGLGAAHAIMAIFSITGNLDVPGGMALYASPFGLNKHVEWGSELVTPEFLLERRPGTRKYPIVSNGYSHAHPDELLKVLETDDPYPVRGLWVQSSNPIACMSADPIRAYKALEKIEFTCVVDAFMTPTAMAFADVFLPITFYPEKNSLKMEEAYALGAIVKAVEPAGETRSDQQIVLELGKRFNPDAWPWDTVEDMLTDIIRPTGKTFQELVECGSTLYDSHEYRRYEKGLLRPDGQVGFNTPTGRVELWSTALSRFNLDPLPYYEEPPKSPVSTPDLYKEYPLVLTTGRRHVSSFHSEHRQIPHLRAQHPYPTVEINPETATRYGIEDGDWVWIENDMGRCRQKAKVTEATDPRVVMADHGWWFPEQDGEAPNLYGAFQSNPCLLIDFNPGRSGFGAAYKSLLCKVYKVREDELQ